MLIPKILSVLIKTHNPGSFQLQNTSSIDTICIHFDALSQLDNLRQIYMNIDVETIRWKKNLIKIRNFWKIWRKHEISKFRALWSSFLISLWNFTPEYTLKLWKPQNSNFRVTVAWNCASARQIWRQCTNSPILALENQKKSSRSEKTRRFQIFHQNLLKMLTFFGKIPCSHCKRWYRNVSRMPRHHRHHKSVGRP